MGGLFLMVMTALSFLLYQYGSDIQKSLDNIEISNTARKIMANGKSSQEQMLLKGETNLLTNLISDKVSSKEQKILNLIYHELTEGNIAKSDITLGKNGLCGKLISIHKDILLDDCITTLETKYNFSSVDSSGLKFNTQNIGNSTEDSPRYESMIAYLNNSRNLNYTQNDVTKTAKLSSNTLYQFDSNLKEIEKMSSGNLNYVDNDSVRMINSENSEVAIANKNELSNIIISSFTNDKSLENNIVVYSDNDKNIKNALTLNKDKNGNYLDLVSEYNDVDFVDNNVDSNIDLVNSFEQNNTTTRKSFSIYK